jgi:hypothetical protein
MIGKKDNLCRLTSWNGVTIAAPSSWEAIVSGTNHLHFESELTPIFEIRWEIIPEKSSSNSVHSSIKQIESLSGKKLCAIQIPEFIDSLLPDFEKFCYTWQDQKEAAVLLLYCRSCTTFFLLQFFHDGNDSNHPLQYIKSLSCHDNSSNERLWSIQDFRVNIPESYPLSGYNLAAGFTKLSFVKKKTILNVCRIAPAAMRLQQQNLESIFAALIELTADEPITNVSETMIRYERFPAIGAQIIMRLRKKKPFCLAALWHDKANDRILGVVMEGLHPLDQQTFNSICNSYETFSTKKT